MVTNNDPYFELKEKAWFIAGCALLLAVFLFFCIVFKGCHYMDNARRSVAVSGQFTEIWASYGYGFKAHLTTDNRTGTIPLTVLQANKFKVGDVVKVVATFDGWGNLIRIDSIEKIDLPK